MRLGLVTDVHSHPTELARALELFRQHKVDRVVTIGDTIDAFARPEGAAEVATLLLEADTIGVWGNHDYSLRGDVPEKTRARFPQVALTLMARMQPRLVIADCHFSHKEASVDPNDITQLWDISDRPLNLVERALQGFGAVPQRWQFVGHYHRWWAATPSGVVAWDGVAPLAFESQERYFVIVGATCEGWCGLLDLEQARLQPLRCGGVEPASAPDQPHA
jgi:calcineurin-like phosphoesterase family protein